MGPRATRAMGRSSGPGSSAQGLDTCQDIGCSHQEVPAKQRRGQQAPGDGVELTPALCPSLPGQLLLMHLGITLPTCRRKGLGLRASLPRPAGAMRAEAEKPGGRRKVPSVPCSSHTSLNPQGTSRP